MWLVSIYHTEKGLASMIIFPKTLYSLRYIWMDEAINVLKFLSLESFIARTDLKSAFHLTPIFHPDDWHLLSIYWKAQYFKVLHLPSVLHSAPSLTHECACAMNELS